MSIMCHEFQMNVMMPYGIIRRVCDFLNNRDWTQKIMYV